MYIYLYIYTHVYTCIRVRMHIFTLHRAGRVVAHPFDWKILWQGATYIYMCIYIYTYIYIYTHVCICVRVRMHIYTSHREGRVVAHEKAN